MEYNGFEFTTKSLHAFSIEDKICNYYDMGGADSSGFSGLSIEHSENLIIYAEKGRIECSASAYPIKDSDSYTVKISNVNITRKHGKKGSR